MPNVKKENENLQKTPPQASLLWRLEVQLSANKPNDWYKQSITRKQASDLIGAMKEFQATSNPTTNDKSNLTNALLPYSPNFELKEHTQTKTKIETKEIIKEVAKQVTIKPDMKLDKIIETILPVVKGASIIKDIYDAKQPEIVKAETSKNYYKPSIFDTVLQALKTPEINVLIKGPAGSGKSLMAAELAKQLELEFYAFSCSGSMRYGHVIGSDKLYVDPETGQTVSKFECTKLIEAFQRPTLVLMDEGFSLAADILIGLNGLFEPSCRTIETRAGKIELHPDCKVIMAANSDGRNLERNYAGAKRVDGSTLDRFVTFKIDYSKRVEREILKTLPKVFREYVGSNFKMLRQNVKSNNVLFDVSTRRLNTCVKLVAAGMKPDQAFEAALLGQLSTVERKKVGFETLPEFTGAQQQTKAQSYVVNVTKYFCNKIEAIKAIKNVYDFDLPAAKLFVESLPKELDKVYSDYAEALSIASKLKAANLTAHIEEVR